MQQFKKFSEYFKKNNESTQPEVTRQDIHNKTLNGKGYYQRGVHLINENLMENNVPLPNQKFGKAVIDNVKELNNGTIGETSAFLRETPILTQHGIENIMTGMFKAARAKSDYNTGKVFSQEVDTGSKETQLGVLSLVGAGATVGGALLSGVNEKAKYNTGSIFQQAILEQNKQNQEKVVQNDSSISYKN